MRTKVSQRLRKARAYFMNRFVAALSFLGAAESDDPCRFSIKTATNVLRITVFSNWLAVRFEDRDLGREFTTTLGYDHLACNPFSGKWNFHFGDNVEELTDDIKIDQVLGLIDLAVAWTPGPYPSDS